MEVQYLGHSSFRLKGKEGVVITDPYNNSVGFSFPASKADVVTVSHPHSDHNNLLAVKPMKDRVFGIEQAGEYDVGGVTVYGYSLWHDDSEGEERGRNIAYSIFVDDVHVLHLGDLGHKLTEKQLGDFTEVDILLCPVGGEFTIDPQKAIDVIAAIEPRVVIPMHYRTPEHDQTTFGALATLEEFLAKAGKTVVPQEKLVYNAAKASDDEIDTLFVVLEPKHG
jgi:L-ascorbate metabolism protein UlaG (beta-lactamase superfamily)